MKLIDSAKQWYKFWSIKLGALGAFLLSLTLFLPDFIYQSWQLLPQDLKALLPTNWTQYIALAVFVLSIVARVIRQDKLHREGDNE